MGKGKGKGKQRRKTRAAARRADRKREDRTRPIKLAVESLPTAVTSGTDEATP